MNDSKPHQDRCAQCGKVLAESAGQTICPACLMRLAVHPSPSEFASPAIDVTQSLLLEAGSQPDIDFPDLPPNQMFGDYLILSRLGRGGMGVVYEAEHLPTSRRVALKVMGHSLDDHETRARFLREGRLAASINHPNSVYVYGTEEIDGRPTISMELVRGVTLGQRVKANGPLDTKAAVDAILQIVDGMEAAYNSGVLHRDIKPNNCFVDADGQVKVGDFGLSITAIGRDMPVGVELARTQTELTQVGSFLGTPAYASPEQLRGEPLDHRSDIYAIGVTLYYLLTGEVPFSADNMIQLLARVLDNTAPSLKDKGVDASEELELLIAKCLKKAPGDRFASYADLRASLLPLSSRVPDPAPLGSRFLAGALDYLILTIALSPLSIWLASRTAFLQGDPLPGLQPVLASVVGLVAQWAYFAMSEWRYGKTVGKRLLGLQVVQGESRPSLLIASIRAIAFIAPPLIPTLVIGLLSFEFPREVEPSFSATFSTAIVLTLIGWSRYLIYGAMFMTARSRNGYAAVHDLASGTRVVQQFQPVTAKHTSFVDDAFDAKGGTELIGPYHVLQRLGVTNVGTKDEGSLLLGYDATLLRRVWLHVRGSTDNMVLNRDGMAQARTGRLRWLGGHGDQARIWDAYEALTGWPIRNDAAKSVGWSASAVALGKLSDELSLSLQEENLPTNLSVDHVWLTEDGTLKLLPFAVADEGIAPTERSLQAQHSSLERDSSGAVISGESQALQVLRSIAKIFAERFHPTNASTEAMSLSQSAVLEQLSRAKTQTEAQTLIKQGVQSGPTIHVPYRIAGMIAATLILPFFTIVSMSLMAFLYQSQEASMPRVRELADVLVLMDMVGREASGEESLAQTGALQTYARANYQDVWENRAQMQSLFGQMLFIPHRQKLNEIFAAPAPTVAQSESAAIAFSTIREQHGDLPRLTTVPFSVQNAIFWGTIWWLECIWLPSLVTAILFRGGLILRLFGLTLANRRGKPASRMRVFVRMFATGIFPLSVLILILFVQSSSTIHLNFDTTMMFASASFVGIACVAAVIYRSRRRFFCDQCAGTYLVAR